MIFSRMLLESTLTALRFFTHLKAQCFGLSLERIILLSKSHVYFSRKFFRQIYSQICHGYQTLARYCIY